MSIQSRNVITRLTVVMVLLFSMLSAASLVTAQVEENSYTDNEYGVTISWTDQWVVDATPEDSPFLVLTRDKSITAIIMIEDGQIITPEDVVWSLYEEGDELIEDGSSENPPYVISQAQDTGEVFISEALSINNGEATVFIGVSTIPVLQSVSITIASEEITVNESPVLTGPTRDNSGDTTADATAETSGRASRSSRDRSTTPEATTESQATEQPEDLTGSATEEPTAEITRTSRTGSGDSETPVATEEPTTEPTVEPTEIPTEEPTAEPTEDVAVAGDAGTYASPVWGYTFTYDTAIWDQADTFESLIIDSVRLDGETTTVFFTGTNEYGADPVACLEGEDAYFSSEVDNISGWELTTSANGDSLRYESNELAWGVFSYTFHSSTGVDVEFVDYISCETIPGEDAVLIVQMTSFPDEYNDNLDAVLDILETLEFAP